MATGVLSEGDVAPAIRDVLRRHANVKVLLGEVVDIDLETRHIEVDTLGTRSRLPYDSLIVAAGAQQSYFGHPEFAAAAPGLKTIDDALDLRGQILGAFEMAELSEETSRRDAWLTFAIVGAGATGVEIAGQIAELSRRGLAGQYRSIDPRSVRIVLLDAGDAVLSAFPARLRNRARHDLERLGVELKLHSRVTGVDVDGLDFTDPDGAQRIAAYVKVWAAGVEASPLGGKLVPSG